MQDKPVTRVNYFDRQFLRTGDFVAEQAYHLAMHRRHVMGQHLWGIVAGLRVKEEDKKLIVEPGLAIDGYGRELLLPQGYPLNLHTFDDKGSDVLDVWLTYARIEAEAAPKGYAECGADPQLSLYRAQEVARVDLRVPSRLVVLDGDDGLTGRRQPPGVPEEDLSFNPARTPPDDPTKSWPVFLGYIRRSYAEPYTYDIILAGRPYAGLVGEAMIHPADQARVDLGNELEEETSRFAVSLYDPTLQRRVRRLNIDDQGDICLAGQATIYGDLIVDGGSIEFGAGPAYAEAKPWRIYRVTGVKSKEQLANKPSDPGLTQLRIEMEAGPEGQDQVVIGAWSEEEQGFKPCLTVDDQGGVTVHGNLVVQGRIDGKVEVAPSAKTVQPPAGAAQALFVSALMGGFTGFANALRVPLPLVPQLSGVSHSKEDLAGLLRAVWKSTNLRQDEIFEAITESFDKENLSDLLRAILKSSHLEQEEIIEVIAAIADKLNPEVKNVLLERLQPVMPSGGSGEPSGGGNG